MGKLTVGSELKKMTGFPLFHNHLTVDLTESLFEFGSAPFIALREKIWLESLEAAFKAKLKGVIFTFAFEKTVSNQFIPALLKMAKKYKGRVEFVELVCDLTELKKRIVSESRTKYNKLISYRKFSNLFSQGVIYKAKSLKENLVVDTTKLSAKQAATQIFKRIHLK